MDFDFDLLKSNELLYKIFFISDLLIKHELSIFLATFRSFLFTDFVNNLAKLDA